MLIKEMRKVIKNIFETFGLEINTIKGKQQLAYKNEIQRLRAVGKTPFASIIDIGANTGQFAAHARAAFPMASIISFEPIEACFVELKKRFAGDENFKAYNCAIGCSNRKATFYNNDYAPSSSLLQIAEMHVTHYPKTAHTTATTIEEKMFEEVVSLSSLRKPCLIKIDVQGYELEVIRNNPNMLKLADAVIIETSFEKLYKSQPLFDEVYQSMLRFGFVYGGSYDQLYAPGTHQIIQADAIFYNTADADLD
ncbi:MAG: FkbM family methyltransferase [Bacteroidetes bacterium]|nr:MAG: FkbM family methyltransferase [Bacteroidota bacterium]